MLRKMGFSLTWIHKIMKCVELISYSMEIGEFFYPSRGLQQGDLISPYLFLICSEGLSTLL
ncbi:reverse transcriptase [Gossypium australe]|uniref:Reverse transcriptase n=1 Tax=Gossypium australe TaxID=47621 RepID=A0A5B6UW47_9ROSI|nr:reverse transcriptase [Gossypium australe]